MSRKLGVYEGWVSACHAAILREPVLGIITALEQQRYKEVEACAKCAANKKARGKRCPVRADRRQPRWLRVEIHNAKPRRGKR